MHHPLRSITLQQPLQVLPRIPTQRYQVRCIGDTKQHLSQSHRCLVPSASPTQALSLLLSAAAAVTSQEEPPLVEVILRTMAVRLVKPHPEEAQVV